MFIYIFVYISTNNSNSSNSDFFHFAIPSNLTEIKKETKLNANKLVSNEDVRFYSKRS